MSDQTSVTVQRVIEAPVDHVFDVLSNPERHQRLDGSGFVRSVDHADRIQQVGQVFTMNMEGPHMGGEYQTDNHVTGYAKDKLLAWQTAPAGTEPPGWEWVWELESQGPDSTLVRHTYDWSKVTDKDLLEKIKFPLVTETQLEDTLAQLAAEAATD
ncbi:SRPBCC domain-containing protein [Gordonia sp. HY285]|uniref:SRPBCC family protein n=1 Tax=Gordonia liuliyuniae TaxID=2911517 RepID=UPI001F3D116E|nr:SRPBCC family protein [Gordonia liuliyuniae]MCF8611190.1 SRPBCC domain-containing protein [Gordonia liuliyuniae]